MRDLSVNSWISWRSMKWRLPWHGKGFMAMRFHPPQAEQQLPSQSVGKDFGKAKGRQTHDGMKTGASWCHWSKGRSWCGSNLNKTGWTSQLILQMRVFTTRVCWDFSATSVFFPAFLPANFPNISQTYSKTITPDFPDFPSISLDFTDFHAHLS